jgi:hypothetical protein
VIHETVIVPGALAQRPHVGGRHWVPIQYPLGFRRPGWDVRFSAPVMNGFGLGEYWTLL